MKVLKVKISEIKTNPKNPRLIKDDKFRKLVKSIQEFPQMLELRPIVVDENNIVLGGNMRLKACIEVGLKEEHLNQIHRYFLVGGFDLFVVIYENKDNQEWTEWVVTPEPKRLKQQEEELSRLNQAVETETLPVMLQGCQTRNSQEWKQCPFAGNQGVCVQAQSYNQVQQMISNPPQDS